MSASIPPQIDQLMIRFLAGEANPEEQQQLEAWAAADPKHQHYLEEMMLLWQHSASAREFAGIDSEKDWQKVNRRIKDAQQTADERPLYSVRFGSYFWLKAAASIVLIVGLLIGFYRLQVQPQADALLIATATDHPMQLTLSDGTKVYLNQYARLTYPKQFSGQTREVILTGEAFFEVAKNPAKPFLITSGVVVTRVIGTSFSVNAPTSDSIRVTVLTGQVSLSKRGLFGGQILLTPGEQGAYRRGQLAETLNTDTNFLAWKTGVLSFENTPLSGVIQDLNRYYHQKIELSGKPLESCRLTSTFRKQSLDDVLAEIQLVLPIQIQRNGDHITLSGKGCL